MNITSSVFQYNEIKNQKALQVRYEYKKNCNC